MSTQLFRQTLMCGAAALVIATVAGSAVAQAAEPPAGQPAANASQSGPPAGATPRPRTPLADPSNFPDLAQPAAAPSAAPSDGIPGVSGQKNQSSLEQPETFGSSKAPYTTSRVAVTTLGTSTSANATPVTSYPYRATGRLWMKFPDGWYVCTASVIGKNILITAAHCVHNYGKKATGYASQVQFVPAQYSTGTTQTTPYGTFNATKWRVLSPYYNGTDTCAQSGVVCNNDLATVVLAKNGSGQYVRDVTGSYAYGWNGYSYTTFFSTTVVELTQLGYPVALDKGMDMERTDATGWYYSTTSTGNGKLMKNTQLGSAQTGGSSGGPWLVNFGRPQIGRAHV
jgi:V8-like Glu-specific endopeptidase